MSDLRRDIERAIEDHGETAKGAAALGGGIIAGRYIGKRVMRALAKRNVGKTAMEHVKMGDAVTAPDNFSRFKSAAKAKRK